MIMCIKNCLTAGTHMLLSEIHMYIHTCTKSCTYMWVHMWVMHFKECVERHTDNVKIDEWLAMI